MRIAGRAPVASTALVVERDNPEGLRRLEESSQYAVALIGGAVTSAFDAAALSAVSAGAQIALLPAPGAAPSLAPGDAYPESRTQSASWLDGCKSILTTITKPIRRVSHRVSTGIVVGIKCIRMPKTAFARFKVSKKEDTCGRKSITLPATRSFPR